MADTSNLTKFLKDVAAAIKDKKGTTEPILAANFDIEIKTIDDGIDTSDATATEIDLVLGKTAYVNGKKIQGVIPEVNAPDGEQGTLVNFLDNSESETNTTLVQVSVDSDVFLHTGAKVNATVPYDTITTEFEITSDKIVSGNTILGVEGTASGASGEKYAPRRITFSNYSGTELDYELSCLDISNITNMSNMFSECSDLVGLGVDDFDTSRVTNMSFMFNSCRRLSVLNVSNFNTSGVTDMSFMFNSCVNITRLDLSNFDTSNVENMSMMFSDCSSLIELDISSFVFKEDVQTDNMFDGIPADCLIYVKDETTKEKVLSIREDLTNVVVKI